MKRINNVTLGSDPEVFVVNEATDEVISAIGLIPGSKREPFHPADLPEGFCLQTDNILAEFNVPAVPLEDGKTFIANLYNMREYINQYVKEINPNYGLKSCASAFVDYKYLNHPQAMLFGCDPDYNCYSGDVNPKPGLIKPNFRSCGVHIHVGYDNPDIKTSIEIVKYLDSYLGLFSVIVDPDRLRRTLYGKAGCFRLQKYGVEYRTLSGYFIKDVETISFVYDRIVRALEAFDNNEVLPDQDMVMLAINESDVDLAKKIINDYNLL